MRKSQNVQKTLKIFINNMNSWFSNFVIEQFRTDHTPEAKQKNDFMGTMNTSSSPTLPKYFEPKIITFDYNPSYKSDIFSNDIIIYNLNTGNFREIDYIIKGMKTLRCDSEKVVILISSIMAWAKTPTKYKENETDEGEVYEEPKEEIIEIKEEEKKEEAVEEEKKDEVKEEDKPKENNTENKEENNNNNDNVTQEKIEEEKKEIPQQPVIEEEPKKKIIYYTENEYNKRVPHAKYIQYKLVENQIISLNQKNNVRAYVICPGVIYGYGEQFFYDICRTFYLNLPLSPSLSFLMNSDNTVPTIHIKDIITLIKRVIDRKPQHKYIFAFDQTENRRIKTILKSIEKSISISPSINENIEEGNNEFFSTLSIDLKAKPSTIFYDEKREGEDKEDYEKRAFKWHCQFGIKENMNVIRKEFYKYRGFKRNKILILGSPYSGKSSLSTILAKTFHLSQIKINDVVEYGKKTKDEKLKKEIEDKLTELESTLKEAEEAYNKRPNKKKTDSPFNPSQHMKLPMEIISKIYWKRLNENDCFLDGYIMDGYPKTYNEANSLFEINIEDMDKKEKEELNNLISPSTSSVILLSDIDDESALARVKESEVYQADQNGTLERANRRLNKVKELEGEEGYKKLEEYFTEKGINVIKIDAKLSIREIAKKAKEAIVELNGRKVNVNREMMDVKEEEYDYEKECVMEEERIKKEEEEKIKAEEEAKEKEMKEKEEKEKKEEEKKEDENKEEKKEEPMNPEIVDNNKDASSSEDDNKEVSENEDEKVPEIPKTKLELEKEREFKLLEKKTEVLRRYLSENVLPVLSKGILDVCIKMPDDPVEALANFLLDSTFDNQLALQKDDKEPKEDDNENIPAKEENQPEHEEPEMILHTKDEKDISIKDSDNDSKNNNN